MLSVEVGDVGVEGEPPSREVVRFLLDLGYGVYEYGTPQEPLRPHRLREAYDYDNLVFLP
jgi:hypothetical protein